jgi:exo-beta-1,3-glucanase (GH17 family)
MDLSVPGRKVTLRDILLVMLPDEQRTEFREWADSTNTDDFVKGLAFYFDETEIRNAVGEYVGSKLEELEHFCDVRIDAVITVRGGRFEYRSYNEAMQT